MKKILSTKKNKTKIPLWLVLIAGGGLITFLLIIGLIGISIISQATGTLNPTIEQKPVLLNNEKPNQSDENTLSINVFKLSDLFGGFFDNPITFGILIFVSIMLFGNLFSTITRSYR